MRHMCMHVCVCSSYNFAYPAWPCVLAMAIVLWIVALVILAVATLSIVVSFFICHFFSIRNGLAIRRVVGNTCCFYFPPKKSQSFWLFRLRPRLLAATFRSAIYRISGVGLISVYAMTVGVFQGTSFPGRDLAYLWRLRGASRAGAAGCGFI